MSNLSTEAEMLGCTKLRRLAAEMRANAGETKLAHYSEKLQKAADELDVHAELLEQLQHGK